MIETELKITLDDDEAARLRRRALLAELRIEPRRVERLLSIYCDTEGHALAKAGIALRLRRVGRRWVQTIKRGRSAGGAGLYAHEEIERPAPGGRLALEGDDPSGACAAVTAAAADAPLAPVFETRVERMSERLKLPGGVVELALDRGEIVAGTAREPIVEAEIELIEGDLDAVFDLARRLFDVGPVRFATSNKSERGYGLAQGGGGPNELAARRAGTLSYEPDATVETVARDVLRDCFAQIAENAVVVARTEATEGPHQLRVGLRRLRTAIKTFAPSLGEAALAPLAEEAKELGRVVGRLRDADVLVDEVVTPAAGGGLDAAARSALVAALEARRVEARTQVRAALAGPACARFLFDLLEAIEGRRWLAPADYSQTERLAAPIGSVAPGLLDKRRDKALRRGRGIEKLDPEALHALRKELKKLRYAADVLEPIYSGKKAQSFMKALKGLQDAFGSLNDAAMAVEALSGPDAPARADPDAQRAVGWVLGTLEIRVGEDRPRLFERWRAFAETKPFWD